MKCQSEFGTETDDLLRQADDCTEDWWDGEAPKGKEQLAKRQEEDDSGLIVKREVRKRGLDEGSEEAGV
jgi:hypothetical protein